MVTAVDCVAVLWTQNFMALSWLAYSVRHPPGVAKFFDRGGALQKIFQLKKYSALRRAICCIWNEIMIVPSHNWKCL